jgi:hypothetical protein
MFYIDYLKKNYEKNFYFLGGERYS